MKRFVLLLCLLAITLPTFAYDKIRQERDTSYMNIIKKGGYFEKIYNDKYLKTSKYGVTDDTGTKDDYYDIVTKPNQEIYTALLVKREYSYDMPILNSSKTYYDATTKLEDIIKSRRIYFFVDTDSFPIKKIDVEYNSKGKITKLGDKNLIYDEDGSLCQYGLFKAKYGEDKRIKRFGLMKVSYNDKGQITSIGNLHIKYNSFGEIHKLEDFNHSYKCIYKVYDKLELYEYYLKMLSDEFFNKYKYSGPRYETYTNFFKLEVVGQDDVVKAKYDCNLKFAKFFRLYLDYVYLPNNYDNLTEEEKLWFLSQVVETQNWMKTHNVDYTNPYEENFRKQVRTVVKKSNKVHIPTEEELLRKEITKLNKQIDKLQKEQKDLKDKQEERIRYIDGQPVQYDSSGRIYSIGGKRVQY